jgi:hypothetical protein
MAYGPIPLRAWFTVPCVHFQLLRHLYPEIGEAYLNLEYRRPTPHEAL